MSVDLSAQHTPAVSAAETLRLLAEGAEVGSLIKKRVVSCCILYFGTISYTMSTRTAQTVAVRLWKLNGEDTQPHRHRLLNTISTATAQASRSKRSNGRWPVLKSCKRFSPVAPTILASVGALVLVFPFVLLVRPLVTAHHTACPDYTKRNAAAP
jgi:hypothetical protein